MLASQKGRITTIASINSRTTNTKVKQTTVTHPQMMMVSNMFTTSKVPCLRLALALGVAYDPLPKVLLIKQPQQLPPNMQLRNKQLL